MIFARENFIVIRKEVNTDHDLFIIVEDYLVQIEFLNNERESYGFQYSKEEIAQPKTT
jgi:hypothetical protein